MKTLVEARDYVVENRGKGVKCPCCGRFVKLYKRPLGSTIARWLIALVRRFERERRWYSVHEPWSLLINGGTGDVAKLRFWELVLSKSNDDPQKKSSGLWIPTDRGVDFVHGRRRMPRHCYVDRGNLEGFSRELITIQDALGKGFDYRELMEEVV